MITEYNGSGSPYQHLMKFGSGTDESEFDDYGTEEKVESLNAWTCDYCTNVNIGTASTECDVCGVHRSMVNEL